MREIERIDRILNLLKQIWIIQPDSRFMQMMSNISWNYSAANNDAYKTYSYSKWETPKGTIFNKDMVSVDCFHLEDDKLELFLQDYLDKLIVNGGSIKPPKENRPKGILIKEGFKKDF